MTNKEIVHAFIEEVFNNHDLSAIGKYVREDYIQHNADVPQGPEGLKAYFAAMFASVPAFRQNIIHLFEDGDYVIAHVKAAGFGPGVYAKVVDIYRLEGGKLAEHWDVLQKGLTE